MPEVQSGVAHCCAHMLFVAQELTIHALSALTIQLFLSHVANIVPQYHSNTHKPPKHSYTMQAWAMCCLWWRLLSRTSKQMRQRS